MTAFSPGQSPPPVSIPMRIGRNPTDPPPPDASACRTPGKGRLRSGVDTGNPRLSMKLPSLPRQVQDRNRWLLAGLGSAAAAGGAFQVAHMRRIAQDPEQAVLSAPPEGRARRVRSADGTVLHVEVFG